MNDVSQLNTIEAPVGKPILIFGVIFTLIGIIAMVVPWAAAITFELLLGMSILAAGVVQAMLAFQSREGRWMYAIGALLFIASGIYMLVSPIKGVLAIGLLVAIIFVVDGITKIILSFYKDIPFHRGLLFFDGILGAILGIMFWVTWPETAAWVLGLLIGIRFLIAGITSIFIGWSLRSSQVSITTEQTIDV